MVGGAELNKLLMVTVSMLAVSCMVLSHPAIEEDQMMADDYDYGEPNDQSQQSKSGTSASSSSSFPKMPSTWTNRTKVDVTGILGQNIVLKCDDKVGKDNVVLWYQGKNLVSNGNSVLVPNFSLNPKTYELTILHSSPQSSGDYYCEVEPQKIRVHTKVIVLEHEHSLDAIAPESSTSAQSHVTITLWLLAAASSMVLYHFKINI
ncbi:uncharacterized protein LOC115633743 [Scaptodrosophila lebanonensis]|uniref:Uncharacterized protein LOC115633743 n=1 Tax=Drosophila lebanonensis TaxID=7225 RepID=A0A6J2UIP5_DROLE|nr:uncharacterized protein LOC115633743 [Scaptodrosophila lebanonensis]